jgi:nicotinamide-nucleotide amidase
LPPLASAAVIAVGSELLTPFRADTNSLAITSRLEAIGVRVRAKAVAGDSIEDIARSIRDAASRVDLIVLSGGLGPTADDLTRDAVAAFAGVTLREDPSITAWLEARFAARGTPMPAINRRQAMVPAGAQPLPNAHGSAPGLLLERPDITIAALPGPPRELMPMLDLLIADRLARRAAGTPLMTRVLKVTGRGESAVDEIAAPIYLPFEKADPRIQTTILASPGLVELHLQCPAADGETAARALDLLASRLEAALVPGCFTTRGESLEGIVGTLLTDRGLRIAVAESCTAGMVAARLTDVAGSSAYVRGGVIAYDNDIKMSLLDVPAALLAEHGAVSEPVARAMANGVRARLSAGIGVAVTGIAGPTGGTPTKPTGTVVVAATGLGRERVHTFRFIGDRALVRAQSVQAALDSVRRLLLDL